MKRLIFLVVVLTFALALVGCKPVTNHLDNIKAAGKLVVGTSADYRLLNLWMMLAISPALMLN